VVDQRGTPTRWQEVAKLTYVTAAAIPGIAVAIGLAFVTHVDLAILVGWDVAAAIYLTGTWVALHRMDAPATAAHAVRDDQTRSTADLTLLVASAASLGAVAVLVVRASDARGASQVWQASLAIVSVVMSWFIVHTTYLLRYATIYHSGTAGGVNFNQVTEPRYMDFAYLAFTIGMTFQVSDTSLTSSEMRATALRHALLSYLYGTVIIAATINLIAGLNK
jgi:uncharacterized membrane protein